MKKFTTVAAMLAMVLVAAVPATAQTVEGNEGDDLFVGDGSTAQIQSAEQVQYSANVLDAQTDTNNNIGGDTGDENAIGGGNVDQSVVNNSSQVLQQAQADDGSFASNGNVFDNEDENESVIYFEDADFDGIADVFDYFVLFGDFDNDGINDEEEASAEAFAFANGDEAYASASAVAYSN